MIVKIGKNEFKLIRKPEISIDMEHGNIFIVVNLEDNEEKIYELKTRISYNNQHCHIQLLRKE